MTSIFNHNQKLKPSADPQTPRVRISARITTQAHDAIIELQRRHRRTTGKALRLWEVLDAAVLDYAKEKGIERRA